MALRTLLFGLAKIYFVTVGAEAGKGFRKPREYIHVALIGIHADEVS